MIIIVITVVALSVPRCFVSEALRVLRIRRLYVCSVFGGFTCAPSRRLYVFCTGCASVLHSGGFTCAPYSEALRVLRVGGFTYFARAVLRSFIILYVWSYDFRLLNLLNNYAFGFGFNIRINNAVSWVITFGCVGAPFFGVFIMLFILLLIVALDVLWCSVLCSISESLRSSRRDSCTQGAVLHFRSLYAPCLERLLHSRCGTLLSEYLFSVAIAGTLPL